MTQPNLGCALLAVSRRLFRAACTALTKRPACVQAADYRLLPVD